MDVMSQDLNKDLNEASEREPYYCRSVNEIITTFNGATVFTLVDKDKGHWQVELNSTSGIYICMVLDTGKFQQKRLPKATAVPLDIFWKKLDSACIGLTGVTGIPHDMIICYKKEEHNKDLTLFLEVTRQNRLCPNKVKLQFKNTEVSFFGNFSRSKESEFHITCIRNSVL